MKRTLGVGRPIVLIVEDEVIIRVNAVAMIEDAGFQALEAANADEAIRMLESRDDIRIVFTDVNMPGSINGLNLAHAIRDRWPPIKLIIASGQMVIPDNAMPSGSRFFSKPYQSADITQVLQELVR